MDSLVKLSNRLETYRGHDEVLSLIGNLINKIQLRCQVKF